MNTTELRAGKSTIYSFRKLSKGTFCKSSRYGLNGMNKRICFM